VAEGWEAPPSIAAKEKCPHPRRPSIRHGLEGCAPAVGPQQRLTISHAPQVSGETSHADPRPHPLTDFLRVSLAAERPAEHGAHRCLWPLRKRIVLRTPRLGSDASGHRSASETASGRQNTPAHADERASERRGCAGDPRTCPIARRMLRVPRSVLGDTRQIVRGRIAKERC
jgi:hypothetical protein